MWQHMSSLGHKCPQSNASASGSRPRRQLKHTWMKVATGEIKFYPLILKLNSLIRISNRTSKNTCANTNPCNQQIKEKNMSCRQSPPGRLLGKGWNLQAAESSAYQGTYRRSSSHFNLRFEQVRCVRHDRFLKSTWVAIGIDISRLGLCKN